MSFNRKFDIVAYISLLFMSFINSIQIVYESNVISQAFYFVFFGLFCLSSFDFRGHSKNLFISLVGMAIVLVSFILNGASTISFFASFLVIWFSENLDKDNCIKSIIIPRFIVFIFVLVLCLLGVLENKIIYRETLSHQIINYRYSLGFPHPNVVFWFIFPAYCGYIYLRKGNISIIEYFIHAACFYLLFIYTDCRTGFYTTISLILICILYRLFPKLITKFFKLKVFRFAFIFGAIISIVLSYLYLQTGGNEILKRIDIVLSYRLSLAASSIVKNGISILGSKVDYANTMDSTYIYMCQSYGVVFVLFYCLVMYFMIREFQKKDSTVLIIIVTFFSVYFLFEKVYLNILNNFSLFFIGNVFFTKDYFEKDLTLNYEC